jgi:hypothetical protein
MSLRSARRSGHAPSGSVETSSPRRSGRRADRCRVRPLPNWRPSRGGSVGAGRDLEPRPTPAPFETPPSFRDRHPHENTRLDCVGEASCTQSQFSMKFHEEISDAADLRPSVRADPLSWRPPSLRIWVQTSSDELPAILSSCQVKFLRIRIVPRVTPVPKRDLLATLSAPTHSPRSGSA